MRAEPGERRICEQRLSRWLKVILRLTGIAAVVGMALWVIWRDEPPPADEDLRNYRRIVKVDDNGFRLVDVTKDDIAWPGEEVDEDLVQGYSSAFDREKAAEIATRNALVFEKVDLALSKPDFQVKELQDMEAQVPHLLGWRRLAYALASRSRLRIEEGKPEHACADALRLIRLGGRIQRGQGTLVEYLVGIAVQAIGNQRLAHMAIHGQLPVEVLRRAMEELAPEIARVTLADVLKAEYVWISNTFDRFAAGTITDPDFAAGRKHFRYVFKANQTKRLLADEIRRLIEIDAMPVGGRKTLDLSKYDPVVPAVILFRSAGKTVLRSLLPVYEKSQLQADSAHTSLAAIRVLLALVAYRAERGRLPDSLEALVPAYLAALPIDPYTGRGFLYSAAKMVLYSPGVDGVGAGGSTQEDAWQALNDPYQPTLRLDPAAWKLNMRG